MTLKLNGSSSGYTAIDAPAAAGSNTLTLPTTNGSAGQLLSTDGSGNLSWVDKPPVLQVVSAERTDTFVQDTLTGGTYYDVLTCNITPSATSSKIFIQYHLGQVVAYGGTDGLGMVLRRGTTNIALGDAASNRNRYTIDAQAWDIQQASRTKNMSGFWIDSPSSTSAITYRISFIDTATGGKICVGRSEDDGDTDVHARTPSQLILMEVAG